MIELTARVTMTAMQIMEFGRLTEAASQGDGGAACRLGDMYREQKGGLRYSPRCFHHWYSRSALAGDASGQNNLGACYEHGLGCAQSYANAVKWYRLAAAQRHGTASMNLGYCYLYGHGVSADKAEALRLFRLAVEQGEDKAKHEVERLARPAKKPKVRFVNQTEKGRNFAIIGIGGVTPPKKVVPEEERPRREEGSGDHASPDRPFGPYAKESQ